MLSSNTILPLEMVGLHIYLMNSNHFYQYYTHLPSYRTFLSAPNAIPPISLA